MKLFDANAMIGAHFAPRFGATPGVAGLLDEMDRIGVAQALVSHCLAHEYSLAEGNRMLSGALAGQPRLHPCWIVAPHHTGEMPPPRKLIAALSAAEVRAVRLVFGGPLAYAPAPDAAAYGELFACLAEKKIPMFLEFGNGPAFGAADLAALDLLLAAHPNATVIVGARTKIDSILTRLLYPRLAKHRNFLLDLSGCHWHRAIEDVVNRFGAGRLIFGTGFPWFGMGGAAIALAYARISDNDRNAIASGNIKNLLAAARP